MLFDVGKSLHKVVFSAGYVVLSLSRLLLLVLLRVADAVGVFLSIYLSCLVRREQVCD